MLDRLLVTLACTSALAAFPAPIPAQASDGLRPRIVVDAFSFGAPVEMHQRQQPRYQPPLPGAGGSFGGSPSRPPFPIGGGWNQHAAAPLRADRRDDPAPPVHGYAQAASAAARHAGDDTEALQQLGQGVADLLVERLLETGRFRILERQRLDALRREREIGTGEQVSPAQHAKLIGARYYITGTITRFGTEDRNLVGGGGTRGGIGILGIRRRRTEVALVARIVDTGTGEVIASVRGMGTSGKGSGVTLGGIGGGVGALGNLGSSEFRSSALGEATERAVSELAGELARVATQLPEG